MSEEESSQEVELVNQRSDEEESDADKQEGEVKINFLEELKGDNPKIFGYDYYNVIYGSAATLSVMMLSLYFTIEDPAVKQMVMIQGLLSVGLLLCCLYFRKRMQQEAFKTAIEKKKQELAALKKASKSKRKSNNSKKRRWVERLECE